MSVLIMEREYTPVEIEKNINAVGAYVRAVKANLCQSLEDRAAEMGMSLNKITFHPHPRKMVAVAEIA